MRLETACWLRTAASKTVSNREIARNGGRQRYRAIEADKVAWARARRPKIYRLVTDTVPTASFRILYVFLVLRHDRREVVHFNVTEHPTAQWTGQQMVEAFPWDPAPRYLLRDRDKTFGTIFRRRVHSLDMREVIIAPRSPWQNPYVERLIGSIRRECLDHAIVFNELHLKRLLRDYFSYYHTARTHLALDKQCPEPRSVELPDQGTVISFPHVGGLHNEYRRAA